MDGKPILARPVGRIERGWRWVKRNRAVAGWASITFAAMAIGIGVSIFYAIRAEKERTRADAQFVEATTSRNRADQAAAQAVQQRHVGDERAAEAQASAERAKQAELRATVAAELEASRREQAERQTRFSYAYRLAAQSREVLHSFPQRSLLLAIEALETTRSRGEPAVPAAEQGLRDALLSVGGRQIFGTIGDLHGLFSPDGRWLLTSDIDNDESPGRLWDLQASDPSATGTALGSKKLFFSAFNQDGQRLVTSSTDGTVQSWDLSGTTPQPRGESIRVTSGEIHALAISPDGHWLFVATADGALDRWDLQWLSESSAPTQLRKGGPMIYSLSISSSGRWLAVNGETFSIWDIGNSSLPSKPVDLPMLDMGVDRFPHYLTRLVAFTQDDHWLIIGNVDGVVRLWNLRAANTEPNAVTLKSDEKYLISIGVIPDSRWLAAGNSEGIARVWDLLSADVRTSSFALRGHEHAVTRIAISPDSRWFVTGSADGTSRVWDLTANDPSADSIALRGHEGRVLSVITPPDGRSILTAASDGRPRQWKLGSKDASTTGTVFRGTSEGGFIVSPDGSWLASVEAKGAPRLWHLSADDSLVTECSLLAGIEQCLPHSIVGDNEWLVASSGARALYLWSIRHPKGAPLVLREQSDIRDVQASSDGRWLCTRCDNGSTLWSLQAPSLAAIGTPIEANGTQPCLDPAGHWLAIADKLGLVKLLDLTTSDLQMRPLFLRGPDERFDLLPEKISPDGRWLITSYKCLDDEPVNFETMRDEDGPRVEIRTHLWDLSTANSPKPIVGHLPCDISDRLYGGISPFAFTWNSHRLIVTGRDGTAHICDLTSSDPVSSSTILKGHSAGNFYFGESEISRDNRWYAAEEGAGSRCGTLRHPIPPSRQLQSRGTVTSYPRSN